MEGTYIKAIELPSRSLSLQKNYNIQHIYEVRKMLDLQVSELAVRNHSDRDIVTMEHYLNERKEMLNTDNYAAHLEADVQFHYAVAQSTKNE